MGFPGSSAVKNPPANAGDTGDTGSIPGLGRSPERGNGNPFQYSCCGKSHGQRSLAGYGPQGCKELDTTERLSMHTHWRKPQIFRKHFSQIQNEPSRHLEYPQPGEFTQMSPGCILEKQTWVRDKKMKKNV